MRLASLLLSLDPRLKMGTALILGPGLWLLPVPVVAVLAVCLLLAVRSLGRAKPLEKGMAKSLLYFVVFWVGIKTVLDLVTGMPWPGVAMESGALVVRLAGLLLLGLGLAQSTSPRALGQAISWAVRPFVGRERAWRLALSLAMMIHFLPLCLATVREVNRTMAYRFSSARFRDKLILVPQAVIRSLGQKTWNQTLAVAGRGLDDGRAWDPDFHWSWRDSLGLAVVLACVATLVGLNLG